MAWTTTRSHSRSSTPRWSDISRFDVSRTTLTANTEQEPTRERHRYTANRDVATSDDRRALPEGPQAPRLQRLAHSHGRTSVDRNAQRPPDPTKASPGAGPTAPLPVHDRDRPPLEGLVKCATIGTPRPRRASSASTAASSTLVGPTRRHATRLHANDSARNPDHRRLGEAAQQRQHQEPTPATGDRARGRDPEVAPEIGRHAAQRVAALARATRHAADSYVPATTSLVGAAVTARNAGTCM